jgi:hypothetical protein
VGPVTHRLPGTAAADLAAGISSLLGDPAVGSSLYGQQSEWLKLLSWPVVSAQLAQLIRGEFVERVMSNPSSTVGADQRGINN